MMAKEKDYKNFDYQTVLVKKNKFDEVVNNYKSFGWNVTNVKQHSRYENILEVQFARPHYIKNKDELQFLQVNMECDINKKGRLEKHKHSKSTTLGIVLGIGGILLIIGAVACWLNLSLILGIVLASILAIVGLMCFVVEWVVLKKIIRSENNRFEIENTKLINLINECCKQARILIGAKDE